MVVTRGVEAVGDSEGDGKDEEDSEPRGDKEGTETLGDKGEEVLLLFEEEDEEVPKTNCCLACTGKALNSCRHFCISKEFNVSLLPLNECVNA